MIRRTTSSTFRARHRAASSTPSSSPRLKPRRSVVAAVAATAVAALILGIAPLQGASAAVDTTAPSTPSSLAAGYFGGVGAVITWGKVSASDLAGYRVYRSTTSTVTTTNSTLVATTTSVKAIDSAVTAGSTAYYAVTAFDTTGNQSKLSSAKSIVAKDTTKPSSPASLKATPTASGIALDWADNDEPDLAGYTVSRASSSSGPYSQLTASLLTTSAFADSQAPTGTKSYYRVTAVDLSGNVSSYASTSASRPALTGVVPAAPTSLVATVGKNSAVTLTWSSVSGATGYVVSRSDSANGTFTRVSTATLTTASYTDAAAPAGATAFYRVVALNAVGTSPAATTSIAVPADVTPPAAPTSPKAVVLSTGGESISWKANTEADLAGYVVYRRNSANEYVQFLPAIGSSPLTTPSFTDVAATEGTTTYYRIRAVDRAGNQSSYLAVTAKNPNVAPASPTGFVVTQDAVSGLDLSWVAPKDPDVAGYSIYRSATSSGTPVLISTITAAAAGSPPRFVDTSAPKNVTVYYRVTAQDTVGNISKNSSTVSGTSLTAPTPIAVDVTVLTVGVAEQFATIASAVASIPANSLRSYRVDIDPGTYGEAFELSASNVTLHGLGSTPSAVVISASRAAGSPVPSAPGTTYGTAGSAVVFVSGSNDSLNNLTVSNTFDEAANPSITSAQAVALRVEGDRFIADTVRLLGNQDTLLANTPKPTTRVRQYYVNSYLEGDVDYLFGAGTAVFDRDTFFSFDRNKSTNGYLTAASTDIGSKYGFLITDSKILSSAADGTINLGRPWHPGADPSAIASVVVMNTYLPSAIDTAAPWDDMASTNSAGVKVNFRWQDARFDEYANFGPGATVNANRPQLTAKAAVNYTPEKYLAGKDGWNPVLVPSTELPATPTGVVAAADSRVVNLTWNNDLSAAVTSWSVYRATGLGAFAKIGSTTAPTYSDTTVTNGVDYRYIITADTRAGASSIASDPVEVLVAPAPLVVDITVDPAATADGSTVFTTLSDALAAAPAGTATNPTVISLAAGRYSEYDTIAKPYTIVVGSTGVASDVVITGNRAAGTPTGTVTNGVPDTYGTSGSATLVITASNVQLHDLTVENAYVEGTYTNGQAVALRTTGDRLSYENVRLLGNQDTLYANSPNTTTGARSYFHNSYLEGDVDFVFGRGTVVFDSSTLKALDHGTSPNGAVTAASTDTSQKYGILINNSRIIGTAPDGSENLGRPWQPGKTQPDGTSVADTNAIAQVVVRDSWLGSVVSTTSTWTNMVNSGTTTLWQNARFDEYDNSGPSAGVSATRPQLTDAQALQYTSTSYLAGSDGWNPVADPTADVAPSAVTGLTATTDDRQVSLSWNDGVESDVVAYRVYRSTGTDAVAVDPAHLIAEVAKPLFTDRGVTNGTGYHYLVVAVDRGANVSAPTAPVSAIPSVKPLVADLTVAADGSGNYTTIQAALAAITSGTATKPKVILVKPGTYREVVSSTRAYITIAGSTGNPRDVVITFDNANGTASGASTCPAVTAPTCGTAGSATVTLSGAGVQVRDLTIANSFVAADHPEIGNFNTQAVALRATGDRQVFNDVRLLGVQDTVNADANGNISADGSGYPRQYYVDSFIEGNVDFVFGRATAVFDRVTFHATAHNGGTIFAPSSASKAFGYLVVDSRIASDNDPGTFALGRPWRAWSDGAYADNSRGATVIRNTWISAGISASQPWIDFAPNAWTDGRFFEYGNTGAGATINANRPQSTDAAASAQTAGAYLAGSDGWNPVLDLSANLAPTAPVGLTAAVGNGQVSLTWQESTEADVTGYRVYRDGALVATTSAANYIDTGLTNGTGYSYTVSALDSAGNESPVSLATTATPQLKIDVTVDPNGAYPTLQAAVAAATGNGEWVIRILPGTYAGTTVVSRSNVTIVGGGTFPADVVLTSASPGATLTVTGSSVSVTGVTLSNTSGLNGAAAVNLTGDRILFDDDVLSAADRAVWADVPTAGATSRQVIEASTITGATNLVLGRATLVIDKTTIVPTKTSGTIFIPSTTAVGGNGILVINSTIAPAAGVSDIRLGGPYAQGATTALSAPQTIIRDSVLAAGIKSSPWQDFNGYRWTDARFAEYGNTGAGAVVNANRPQLTPADSVAVTVSKWIGAPTWYPAVADPATPADIVAPAAVTSLTAAAGNASATLTWTPPADGDLAGYRIYRSTVSPFVYTPATLFATIGAVSSFSDAGLTNATAYTYAVKAMDAAGNLSAGDTVSVTPADSLPPGAPTGVTAIGSDSRAILNWTASTEPDLAGYNVYRDTAKLNAALLTSTTFTESGLTNGTSYSYRITAVDSAGNESTPSTTVSATPQPGDTIPPAVPTGVSTVLGRTTVTVKWSAVGDADLAGYDILRTSSPFLAPVVVASVGASATNYVDSTVAVGATYSYSVVSKDASGNASAASVSASATPVKVDVVVAADGTGDATTVQAGISLLADNADYSAQGYRTILVMPGTYVGTVTSGNRYGVNVIGATTNPTDTVITATGSSPTLLVTGKLWTFANVTVQNVAVSPGSVATAVFLNGGDKQVFRNVRILGDGQAIKAYAARSYFVNSFIEGGSDLFIGREAVVDRSTIHVLNRNSGSIISSSTSTTLGFLITGSTILTDGGPIYLARPYPEGGFLKAQVVVRDSVLGSAIYTDQPWKDWNASVTWTAQNFFEYRNTGAGAAIVNPATRPQLADTDAPGYTAQTYLAGSDSWNPVN